MISCSIDPTEEGNAALRRFLQSVGTTFAAGQQQATVPRIVEGLRSSLGMQNVTITGVSSKSHFAQVLVEADYRMKLIGIGLEQPPVRITTIIDRLNPSQVSRNALFRFYFVPDYNCVRVSEDGLAMELVGDGVKLLSEDEMIAEGGKRVGTGRTNPASQAFVTSFTQRYPVLAERSPVYAELRNLIDLAVAAAYIHNKDFYGKAGWTMSVFGNEQSFPTEMYNAPKQVEPIVNVVWRGGKLTTPIGGGVRLEADMALKSENILADEDAKVAKVRDGVKLKLAPGQWWWD